MSRCFPYPPPGYEKSFALVESIKLQNEKEKVKQKRKKEKKREKREKKANSRENREKTQDRKQRHRKRHYEELSQSTYKSGGDYTTTREGEGEQLEKSSLTEEQGCPHAPIVKFCDSSDSTQHSSKRIHKLESVEGGRTTFGVASIQNFCDSSDSTQNSSKRHKHESAEVCRTPHGNGLRIRLPLSRHKDLAPPSSSEQPCLLEQRTQAVPSQPETSVFRRHQPPSTAEQPCFSGRSEATAPTDSHKITDHKSASSEARRTHSSNNHRRHDCCDVGRMHKKLLVDWNPPPLQMENPGVDDQDWLFGKTGGRRCVEGGETRELAAHEEQGSGLAGAPCSWLPRASFLPEVGIHALPYAVPF